MPRRPTPSSRPLAGRVAVVAGATRGAGRGIARALGEAGAIVYCTGRSVRGNPSPYGRPETIDETCGDDRGGRRDRHSRSRSITLSNAEVEALFARVDREQGRLDILADSVGGENPLMGQYGWFWTTDLTNGPAVFQQSLLSHIVTAKHAARLMTRDRRGLIVEVTENDVLSAGGNPLAQTVKFALKGLALSMAAELQPHGVAAIAITPGYLRSESMLQRFGVTEANWRDQRQERHEFPGVRDAVVRRTRGRGARRRSGHHEAHGSALQLVGSGARVQTDRRRRPPARLGRPHDRFLPPP